MRGEVEGPQKRKQKEKSSENKRTLSFIWPSNIPMYNQFTLLYSSN